MFKFCQDLLFYLCRKPDIFAWPPALWNGAFLIVEELIIQYKLAFLHPSSLQVLIPWDSLSRPLKRPKFALLKSRVVTLLFPLFSPLQILNSTISWSLQQRLPWTFTSRWSLPCLWVWGPTQFPHCLLYILSQVATSSIIGVPMEKQQEVTEDWTSFSSLFTTSQITAPGKKQSSLDNRSGQQMGASVPCSRESLLPLTASSWCSYIVSWPRYFAWKDTQLLLSFEGSEPVL